MTEDSCPRVASSSESDSSVTKQRRKRKWDQPAESLLSAGVAVPGILPLANMGYLPMPAVNLVPGAPLAIPFSTSNANALQVIQVPLQQHAASIIQKLVQPKIQDELIAREIVINDADSAIRYRLTKRQTQEEIQKSTGAVVITRGKYHPPNAPPNGERPLYLHISAASHLETTAERIKAVDHAAALVEEMLKQPNANNGVKVGHLLSTCIFLGFEVDPSVDIASRIRGPNDQYVNHIMNETGATVSLRGQRSGFAENGQCEETQQPLHLFLSSNDAKLLERAKLLAENLLDTICAEFGSSRISSCKVYGAVPPPPQLQAGVNSPGNASKVNNIPAFTATTSGLSIAASQGSVCQSGVPNSALPQTNTCYPHGLTSGTSYIGYGGIYPQATPFQQVALALKHTTSPVTATISPAITTTSTSIDPPREVPSLANDKRSQRRKFQELPAAAKGPASINQKKIQGSKFPMPRELTSHVGVRDISAVRDSKSSSFSQMPPPPPKSLLPPPPPPKFDSTPQLHVNSHETHRSTHETVPDTLIKLMEYGDDDDDDNEEPRETPQEVLKKGSSSPPKPKPFWAV